MRIVLLAILTASAAVHADIGLHPDSKPPNNSYDPPPAGLPPQQYYNSRPADIAKAYIPQSETPARTLSANIPLAPSGPLPIPPSQTLKKLSDDNSVFNRGNLPIPPNNPRPFDSSDVKHLSLPMPIREEELLGVDRTRTSAGENQIDIRNERPATAALPDSIPESVFLETSTPRSRPNHVASLGLNEVDNRNEKPVTLPPLNSISLGDVSRTSSSSISSISPVLDEAVGNRRDSSVSAAPGVASLPVQPNVYHQNTQEGYPSGIPSGGGDYSSTLSGSTSATSSSSGQQQARAMPMPMNGYMYRPMAQLQTTYSANQFSSSGAQVSYGQQGQQQSSQGGYPARGQQQSSQGGYNYGQQGQQQSSQEGYPARGQQQSSQGGYSYGQQGQQQSSQGGYPARGQQQSSQGGYNYGQQGQQQSSQGGYSNYQQSSQGGYDRNAQSQQTQQVHKHVYFFKAPPEEQEYRPRTPVNVPAPQKHYKIIFIKTPTYAPPVAPVIPQQAQHEEKTLVYVLVKKPEEAEDVVVPTAVPTQPSKPEVYFIKYKSEKDAHQAVQQLQQTGSVYGSPVEVSRSGHGENSGSVSTVSVNSGQGFKGIDLRQSSEEEYSSSHQQSSVGLRDMGGLYLSPVSSSTMRPPYEG